MSRPRVGTLYSGPVAYCDDYALVPRPGFYALSADGKELLKPLLRLVSIDDAPGDPSDGACHYEVAGRKDPVQRAGRVVELAFEGEGSAEVGA